MRYLSLLLLIVGGQAYGQSYYKDIITNRVIVNYPDHKVNATVTTAKGTIRVHPEKFYYWYTANNIKVTQGGYSGKLLNGPYAEFYQNKNLKEQGKFKKGLKTRIWKSWSDQGILKEQVRWKAGRQSGKFYRYDMNGTLQEKGHYQNGLLNGKHVTYLSSDSSIVVHYRQGERITKKKRNYMPGVLKRALKNLKLKSRGTRK